jgi:hypothetical protein
MVLLLRRSTTIVSALPTIAGDSAASHLSWVAGNSPRPPRTLYGKLGDQGARCRRRS